MSTLPRIALVAMAAASLSACASAYTGPIEVTRFAADASQPLVPGTIAITFPDEISNLRAKDAFAKAVGDQLTAQGFTVVASEADHAQTAIIRTRRNALASSGSGRGPVSVGVGGRTGSYGSGLGVGLGINLGGGQKGPSVMTQLSVRISGVDGSSLWEGRAQLPTSADSPYADVEASANVLASALFQSFPGGNGDTISIDVDELAPQ